MNDERRRAVGRGLGHGSAGPNGFPIMAVQAHHVVYRAPWGTVQPVAINEERFGEPPGDVRCIELLLHINCPNQLPVAAIVAVNHPLPAKEVNQMAHNGWGGPGPLKVGMPLGAVLLLPEQIAFKRKCV